MYPIKVEAPSISGTTKIFSKRPRTSSKMSLGWKTAASKSERPKSMSTVIRSRTSEPRINRKLELLSKQEIEEDDELKPSFTLSIRKKKQILSQNI